LINIFACARACHSKRILWRALVNYKSKSCKLVIGIVAVLVLATAAFSGCIFQKPTSETGVISDVVLSTSVDSNGRPVNPTNVFSSDAPGFYCSFKISGFPVGAKLQVQWIYMGGDPDVVAVTGQNYIAETQNAEITKEGRGYTYTIYAKPEIPDYTWPKGDYKVVISVDDIEKASTTFTVQK
jgi:hypothetical protein